MDLFFPKPAGSGTVPSQPDHHHQHHHHQQPEPSSSRRQPPRNFAEARSLAREIRAPKTPFVTKRTPGGSNNSPGKERDLSGCELEQLTEMLQRNTKLLESPQMLSSLPDGGDKIRDYQLRLQARISEVEGVANIRDKLSQTHINSNHQNIKQDPHDQLEMDTTQDGDTSNASNTSTGQIEYGDGVANSPTTKRKLLDKIHAQNPNALMGSLSMKESLDLQRQAVAREQARQAQLQLAAQRPTTTGHLLKDAMSKNSALNNFMFHADSDEEEEEEDDFGLGTGKAGVLDDDEDAQLNPLRTAYQSGWERAMEPEPKIKEEDDEMMT